MEKATAGLLKSFNIEIDLREVISYNQGVSDNYYQTYQ